MTARLALVLGILVASPALAAKPFPIARQITPEPISLSGQAGGFFPTVVIGPFEGSGSWQFAEGGTSGSGSVQVTTGEGFVRISHSGEISGDSFVNLSIGGPLEIELDVPDLGESTTQLTFVPEAEMNQLSETTNNPNLFFFAGLGLSPENGTYDSSVLGTQIEFPTSDYSWGGSVSNNLYDGTTSNVHTSGAFLTGFIAGDRVRLPLDIGMNVSVSGSCGGGQSCDFSLSWSQTLILRGPFAIAPEPQNRPQTQCFDQADNDGDGKIDLVDPNCTDPNDTSESPPMAGFGCGFGPELALLLPPLWWLRRRLHEAGA